MKIIQIVVLIFIVNCKAQTPIIPIVGHHTVTVHNAYYKDLNSDLDPFTGSWLYSNGSTSFKIVIEKKIMKYNSLGNFYEDLLIGEYRYIEAGVVKVNTLDLMSNNSTEFYEHNIIGNIILASDNYPICTDCLFEKRVSLAFFDPNRSSDNGLWGKLILRRVDQGNVQKIKATLVLTGHVISVDDVPPAYNTFTVPAGNYILTKE